MEIRFWWDEYVLLWGGEANKWQVLISTALATAIISSSSGMPALADLNKYEADIRGEFGIGSAAQYGSADLRFSLLSPLLWFFHI